MDWKLQFSIRPEHFYIGPRRCGKSSIVTALRANGYWAHEYSGESGLDLKKIYEEQRHLPGSSNVPRIFISDGDWWRLKGYFHYVQPHLFAEISFPLEILENSFSFEGHPVGVDWLYQHAADSRDRLIPEIAVAIHKACNGGIDPLSHTMAARKVGANFLESVYPDLVPPLVWVAPEERVARVSSKIKMPRSIFNSRLRSYRHQHPLPHGLTSNTFVEYLVSCGICAYTNNYYVSFATIFGLGLQHLKKSLTHEAIRARLANNK